MERYRKRGSRKSPTPAYPETYLEGTPRELREITERMRYACNMRIDVINDPLRGGKGDVGVRIIADQNTTYIIFTRETRSLTFDQFLKQVGTVPAPIYRPSQNTTLVIREKDNILVVGSGTLFSLYTLCDELVDAIFEAERRTT